MVKPLNTLAVVVEDRKHLFVFNQKLVPKRLAHWIRSEFFSGPVEVLHLHMAVLELLHFLGGLPSTWRRPVLSVLAVLDLNSELVASIFQVTVKDVNFV